MMKPEIIYTGLSPAHLDGAIQCLSESFRQQEPLTRHLQVSAAEFEPFVGALCAHALDSGLCGVAIDLATNTVAGVRVMTNAANDFPLHKVSGLKMQMIFTLLDTVAAAKAKRLSSSHARLAHSHMVGVRPPYQGFGIGKELIRQRSHSARQLGYDYIVGEATGSVSQHILLTDPAFKNLNTVYYDDYRFDGKKPFAGIDGHSKCIFYQLDLKQTTRHATS